MAGPQAIDWLVASLSDDDFQVRERAEVELTAIRFWAERRLLNARSAAMSPEAQTRFDRVHSQFVKPSGPDVLRVARMIEVLERAKGVRAARVLQEIAKRYPDFRYGQQTSSPK